MKKTFTIHPYIFAIFPVLFLYSHNISQLSFISFAEVLLPLAISLGFAIISVVLLWLIFKKDSSKAGIIVSIFLILFFSYGRIYDLAANFKIGSLAFDRYIYLLITWFILLILGTYFTAKTKKDLRNFISILNVIAIVLVLFPIVNIGIFKFQARAAPERDSMDPQEEAGSIERPTDSPDIYYIILDGYAGEASLKEFYNFDNSRFINFLQEKGFYVAANSRSNYPWTSLSLASSLNMEYVNQLSEEAGLNSDDRSIPYEMIASNNVWKFLKSRGYQFVHLDSSGWGPTDSNGYADISIRANWLNEFNISLIQTTMLKTLEKYIVVDSGVQKVLYSFSNLAKVNRIEGPKYVFAHLMTPHPPFFFTANGELIPEIEYRLNAYWDKEKYLDQLIFINSKVEILVDEILSGSEVPPIIIIQGDHGARSTLGDPRGDKKAPENSGWLYPTEEVLRESTFILNAYYLPDGGASQLYGSITPVNTFRLIFNIYFDGDFGLLEDESYYSSYWRPYNFYNTTEIRDYSPQ